MKPAPKNIRKENGEMRKTKLCTDFSVGRRTLLNFMKFGLRQSIEEKATESGFRILSSSSETKGTTQ
jgi:hypothetical protein